MTQVNSPFFLRKILPRSELSTAQANMWDQTLRVLEQMYRRSGGSTDAVDEANTFNPSVSALTDQRIKELESDFVSLGLIQSIIDAPNVISIGASDTTHTTSGNEIVICNNNSTLAFTLNGSPNDGETVSIKRRNAPVVVSGAVDGRSSTVINKKYDAPKLVYTVAAGEWSIV